MNHRRSFSLLCCGALLFCLLLDLPGCSLLHRRRAQDAETANKPAGVKVVKKRAKDQGLTVEMKTEPDPLRLGEVREIRVTFVVHNNGKLPKTLQFPTSQTIEITLRDAQDNKVVSLWSTDRTFVQETRYLVINPNERLEYSEPITTRELKAGRTYNLEASFVGYGPELRATRVIIPQP